jgi:hypothetical protein
MSGFAALSWLLQVLVLAMVSRRSGVSPAYALTAPLGLGLLYAMRSSPAAIPHRLMFPTLKSKEEAMLN